MEFVLLFGVNWLVFSDYNCCRFIRGWLWLCTLCTTVCLLMMDSNWHLILEDRPLFHRLDFTFNMFNFFQTYLMYMVMKRHLFHFLLTSRLLPQNPQNPHFARLPPQYCPFRQVPPFLQFVFLLIFFFKFRKIFVCDIFAYCYHHGDFIANKFSFNRASSLSAIFWPHLPQIVHNLVSIQNYCKVNLLTISFFMSLKMSKEFFKIFVNFKENLMKILKELWKYFAISKRFRVNYKEFPENYSGNIRLTLGKFQRIKKS